MNSVKYIKVVDQERSVADQTDCATRTWKTLLANRRLQPVRCPSEHWIVAEEYLRDPEQPMFSGCALSPEEFADLMVADAALWEIPPLMQTRLLQLMNRMEKTGFDASISPSLPVAAQFLYSSFATHMIHAPGRYRSWYGWASQPLIVQVGQSGEFMFWCAAAQAAQYANNAVLWRLRTELVRYQAFRSMHGLMWQRTLDNLLLGGEH